MTGCLALVCSVSTGGHQKMTPKEECEELMNALVPFAQQMLSKHREFLPFGGTMSVDGKIANSMSSTGEERPTSQALIDLLEDGFREGAKKRLYKATAIVVDILTIPPGKKTKQDAIEVRLDHVSGLSVKVIIPYAFSAKGELEFAEPFTTDGDGKIFGR